MLFTKFTYLGIFMGFSKKLLRKISWNTRYPCEAGMACQLYFRFATC